MSFPIADRENHSDPMFCGRPLATRVLLANRSFFSALGLRHPSHGMEGICYCAAFLVD